MTMLILILIGVAALFAVWMWIHCLHDCWTCTAFSEGYRKAWFVVILLGPIGGPIAYLSAKKNVEKYTKPDPARLQRLLSSEHRYRPKI